MNFEDVHCYKTHFGLSESTVRSSVSSLIRPDNKGGGERDIAHGPKQICCCLRSSACKHVSSLNA